MFGARGVVRREAEAIALRRDGTLSRVRVKWLEFPGGFRRSQTYFDEKGPYRWITVHPHDDPEAKGIPVKIRPSSTNPDTWVVVAGAGGKLNYLRLTKLKSPDEWKRRAQERRVARRDAERERREAEREMLKDMDSEERKQYMAAKRAAAEMAAQARKEAQEKMWRAAAVAAGWDPAELDWDAKRHELKEQGVHGKALETAENYWRQRLTRASRTVLKAATLELLQNPEIAKQAGLDTDIDRDTIQQAIDQIQIKYKRDVDPEIGARSQEALTKRFNEARMEELQDELEQAVERNNLRDIERIQIEQRAIQYFETIKNLSNEEREEIAKKTAERLETLRTELGKALKEGEGYEMPEVQIVRKAYREARMDAAALLAAIGGGRDLLAWEAKALRRENLLERAEEKEDPKGWLDMIDQVTEAFRRRMENMAGLRRAVETMTPKVKLERIQTDAPWLVPALIEGLKAERLVKAAEKAERENVPVGVWVKAEQVMDDAITRAKAELVEQLTASALEVYEKSLERLTRKGDLATTEELAKKEPTWALATGATTALQRVLSVAIPGAISVGRDIVQLLGIEAAAELVAGHIQETLPDKAAREALLEALETEHVRAAVEKSREVREQLEKELKQAGEIHNVETVHGADGLQQLLATNVAAEHRLRDALVTAAETLGTLHAEAACVFALRGKPRDHLIVPVPQGQEKAVQIAALLELRRAEYEVVQDAGSVILKIDRKAASRLLQHARPDPAATEALLAKRGHFDEPDYLPEGIVRYPETLWKAPRDEVRRAESVLTRVEAMEPLSSATADNAVERARGFFAAALMDGLPADDLWPELSARLIQMKPEAAAAVLEWFSREFPSQEVARDEHGNIRYRRSQTGELLRDADGNPIPQMRPVPLSRYEDKLRAIVRDEAKRLGLDPDLADFHSRDVRAATGIKDEATLRQAVYHAVADQPVLALAFTPPADLTHNQRQAIRDWFHANMTPPSHAPSLEELGPEPQKTRKGLFGGEEVTPEWVEWDRKRRAIEAQREATRASSWQDFVSLCGGADAAIRAIQDRMRGLVYLRVARNAAALTKQVPSFAFRHAEHGHLVAGFVDPENKATQIREHARFLAGLRDRVRGKFAAGTIRDRIKAALEFQSIMRGRQGQLFSLADMGAPSQVLSDPEKLAAFLESPQKVKALTSRYDVRPSFGERADNEIGQIVREVASSLTSRPESPVKLFPGVRMSGRAKIGGVEVDLTPQQRAVKMFLARKRIGAFLGTGSGKTLVALGSFTALASKPGSNVRRGLFLVPASIQGQFHTEIGAFVDPSRFKWRVLQGSTYQDRMEAHKSPDLNMVVASHQGFRDDMLKLVGDYWGMPDHTAVADRFLSLSRQERAEVMREAWRKAGVDYQAVFIDEGHVTLNRKNKPEALIAAVLEAASDASEHLMLMTADPLKNDLSEIRSQLAKLTPDGRYDNEAEFLRRYGINNPRQREALLQEADSRFITSTIRPDVQVTRREEVVPLTPTQTQATQAIEAAYERLRQAHRKGQVDVDAAKTLAPWRFSDNQTPEEQRKAAELVVEHLGLVREAAIRRALQMDAKGGHVQRLLDVMKGIDTAKDPVVVFTRHPAVAKHVAQALQGAGHKAVMLTGQMPPPERDKSRRAFMSGEANVMVLTDAGAVGLNLQRAQKLIQLDTPMTPTVHAQRQARIYRLGQNKPIELIDLVMDHPTEHRARERLKRKYELRNIFASPESSQVDPLAELFEQAYKRRTEELAANAIAA
jgi:hypothetical protein